MKKLMNLKGIKNLSKPAQKKLFGGWPTGFGEVCDNPSEAPCDSSKNSILTGNPDCNINEVCSGNGICVCPE